MKKLIILIGLLIFSCSKQEEPTIFTPITVTPVVKPPTIFPPVTLPEPTPYVSGDLTITNRDAFDNYKKQDIKKITGNFKLEIDWSFLPGSSGDPSQLTANIEEVEGDIYVKTNNTFSFESLVKVGGNYTVMGHDIEDSNLVYAKTITLGYEGDYIVNPVFTEKISIDLSDSRSSKSYSSSSKTIKDKINLTCYHPSNMSVNVNNITATTQFPDFTLPDILLPVPFFQTNLTADVSMTLRTNYIKSITMGGAVAINKIESTSLQTLNVNNRFLDKLEVITSVLKEFTMPNLTTLGNLSISCGSPLALFEAPLLKTITSLYLSGITKVNLPKVETITKLEVNSGYQILLPNIKTLGSSIVPSSVRVSSNTGVINQGSVGGGSSGSSSSSSSSSSHNSGGSGHNSGGSGHNSGGSSGG